MTTEADVLADLISRTRTELADNPRMFTEALKSTGSDMVYELPVAPVDAASTRVFIDGSEVSIDEYAVEESTGKLLFTFTPDEDAVISASGFYFRFFTDSELAEICTDSASMHLKGRSDPYGRSLTLVNLDPGEYYPLSLLCAVNALYVLATDAAFDIDIQAPDGLSIPRSQRYQHLMGMIQALKDRYQELSSLLGIGLYAIEIYTLRRVSKRTNRYVAVYRPQEVDDRSRPERVYLPQPTLGGTPVDDGIPQEDLTIKQGDTFSQVVTVQTLVPESAILRAQMRGYAGSPVISGEFFVMRISDYQVVISMSHETTVNLPSRGVWDLQMKIPRVYESSELSPDFGPDLRPPDKSFEEVHTLLRGRVNVPREVTTAYGQPQWPEVNGVTTQVSPPSQQGYQTNQGSWSQNGYNP